MIKASLNDKHTVVNILSQAYDDNDTINETVNEPASKRALNTAMQETRRRRKIYKLMSWGFDLCYQFGEVFLTEDRNATVLILYPEKKKPTVKSLLNELKMALVIGFLNIPKVLEREIAYNKILPKKNIIKVMFLGTRPAEMNKGLGTALMHDLIELSETLRKPMYLESRVKKNEQWYAKHGFKTFYTLRLGDRIWPCMKRIPSTL
jgi:hypothetical protein